MPNDDYHRNRIARELERLAEILSRHTLVKDVGPLIAAAYDCRSYKQDNRWAYHLNRLIFRELGDFRKIPSEAEDVFVELSISAEGYCEPKEGGDPLTNLTLDIIISGEVCTNIGDDITIKTVRSAWHLDRHITDKNDHPSEFIHPRYHFQFGGKNLKMIPKIDDESLPFGATFITDTPRFAHPPMEAILGIDFVLTNFKNANSLNFRCENDEYRKLLQSKQEQIWQPYITSLYQTWQNIRADYPWQSTDIWPQLFPKKY